MKTTFRIVASLILAGGMAVVATPSAAQTTRTLTVTPDTGLADGDVVALEGSGFTPLDTVYFCQGVNDGTPGADDCGAPIGTASTNDAGEFSASYTVQRFISPGSVGATIDCAQPAANCAFGASDFFAMNRGFAFAQISFTPLPPRTLTVTPDTGLVDGDVVAVHGAGFTASDTVYFCQGVDAPPPGFSDCGVFPPQHAQVDGSGEFSANYAVQRFITTSNGAMRDCAAPSAKCAMNFVTPGDLPLGSVPITFAAQSPVPGQIFGTVTDPAGAAVPGAAVWVFAPSDTWVASVQTVTDAQGSYEVAAVDPGVQYRILFGYPSGSSLASEWFPDQPSRQIATVITLSTADFLEANAQLEQAGAISGSVADTNNNPVSGAQVWAFGTTDTWVGSAVASTASDGSYLITNVRPDRYLARFSPPAASGLAVEWFDNVATRGHGSAFAVSSGSTVTGIDAQLANSP